MGGVEGEETAVGIHYVREEYKKNNHGDNSSDIPGGILGQHNLLVPPFCK